MKQLEDHYLLSDDTFEQQFKVGIFSQTFTHEAHLRLAWIYIKKYGVDVACENICEQLFQFAKSKGKEEKFNKTVSVAAVKAVYHFSKRSKFDNFRELIKEFPRLKYKFKSLLDSHYSFDIYNAELPKKEFLEPDLHPFD
jgi:hypothetical protein